MIAFGMPVLPQADESLEVIVVTGRLPGPPLWRVFSGDHVMYIFPMLSLVPEDMDWDSGRVEYLLSASDEVLLMPSIDTDFSPLVLMNPVNLIRGPGGTPASRHVRAARPAPRACRRATGRRDDTWSSVCDHGTKGWTLPRATAVSERFTAGVTRADR
jgi:hypothetical protein